MIGCEEVIITQNDDSTYRLEFVGELDITCNKNVLSFITYSESECG